jgi:3-oxoacyl-[acyl-carrier protein] reductase
MKKNIILIGGSYGIGKSFIDNYSNEYNITVASRSNENLDDSVNYIKYDVMNDDLDISSIPEKLHGFVYLPGSINLRPFGSLSLESFREDLEINLIGLIKTLKFVLNNLKKSESASLVFFSTVAVQKGMAFHSSVSASKGAIEGLSKSLASELSPNIRVNVIAPSLVDTPLSNRFLNNEQKKTESLRKTPT